MGSSADDATDFLKRITDGVNPDFVIADSTPPVIHITSPLNPVTARTRIHLDGYCEERLFSLNYTIYTNGAVSASGRAGITNQTWNSRIRYFTTNFFRCYDLPLAVGLNTIVLQATDLHSNVASLTVNYTLDFNTETGPPVLSSQWPTNGMIVSGTTFTMGGRIDNPSASMVVTVGSADGTNTFYGTASTDGQYWIPDVALGSGTNTLTMVSTTPGGLSTTNTLTLVKASDPISISVETSAMNAFNADHSARVGVTTPGSGWNVSVNGVGAWLNEQIGNTAYWIADDVPGTEEGWMELTATATPSGGGAPVVAKSEWEKPPLLRLKEYHLDEGFVGTGPNDYYVDDYERLDYVRKQGGSHVLHLWSDNGCTASWQWTADDVFTNYLKTCPDGYSSTNYFGYMPSPPTFGEIADAERSQQDGDYLWSFHRSLDQIVELRTGGKPGLLRVGVFNVNATRDDYEFPGDAPPPFAETNAGPVSPSLISVLSATADNDGNIFAAVPTGAKVDPGPIIQSMPKTPFSLSFTNLKVPIAFRASGTLVNRETNVPSGGTIGYWYIPYDFITNKVGTQLGALSGQRSNTIQNLEETSAVVPTINVFDTGWQWHRDVQAAEYLWRPTFGLTGFILLNDQKFGSIPPGSGSGNDNGGPKDETPDNLRQIFSTDPPGFTVGIGDPTGTVLAQRLYAHEWLTWNGAVASEVLRWRSFVTIRKRADGGWERTGTNLISVTAIGDPEVPTFTGAEGKAASEQ